ncbi:MAG: BNR-4 repeat-containing protein [Iamia sp.]
MASDGGGGSGRRRPRAALGRPGLGALVAAALLVALMAANVERVAAPTAQVVPPAGGADESRAAAGASARPGDAGAPTPTVLNDNGGWSWFQDERALLTDDGQLLVASVPDSTGTDGAQREGGTEVTRVDLRSGTVRTDRLFPDLPSDDHNAAALLRTPDRTLALATSHSSDPTIYRAHLDPDRDAWVPEPSLIRPEADLYDPALGRPSGVTYSNLAYLAGENGGQGRTYDVFRSAGETQHLITSDDQGRTWDDRGQLLTPYRAYLKMVSDGWNRIWFSVTDGHPGNIDGSSLYAGYIEGDAIHRADGTVVAPLGVPVDPTDLTLVFAGTPGAIGAQTDAWASDIALDADGRPVITFSTTVPGDPERSYRFRRHEARYARWDGTAFQEHRMADAGTEVGDQLHYTGLSALDPGDPDRVFLSTDSHPVTGAPLRSSADGRVHHEIFEGRTRDGGETWAWAAVTADSREDNLRPVVPEPRGGHSALLWLRGEYISPLVFDLDVVAITDPEGPISRGSP